MVPDTDIQQQYEALTAGVGVHQLSGRTQVELTGRDRGKFLHGLCTNDILALTPGSGCEAFLTNVQGKVVGHVSVFCGESSLVLETVADQAETILAALDRYLIREDVQLHDRSGSWGELLLAGPRCEQLLRDQLGPAVPQAMLAHCQAELAAAAVSLRRVPFVGASSFCITCDTQQLDACATALERAGASVCGWSAVDIARIEAGTPLFGCDITSDNLPQEVDRNELAISFTKGCYLGQETIARIDALGHVNRTLTKLRFDGPQVPPPGTLAVVGDKTAARVTSACWSYKLNAPLALAYVRRGHNRPGTRFTSDYGDAEVVSP